MGAIDDLKNKLSQAREELEVQVGLGAMEARDEWEKLEKQWDHFQAKAGLEKSADSISEAVELLGGELSKSYERLKTALKS